MTYGYTNADWKKLTEEKRLQTQKQAYSAWKRLSGWFHGTLKNPPRVRGFREDGFKIVKD